MKRRRTYNRARAERIRRILVYSLLTVGMATAQCSLLARLHILPVTPDWMLGLVIAILLLDSVQAATVVAIGSGVLLDALGSGGLLLSPLFYFILCLLLFLPASKMLPRFLSFVVLLLPALLLRGGHTLLCMTLYTGGVPSAATLLSVLPAELVLTALFCLPVYWLVRLCRLPLDARRTARP